MGVVKVIAGIIAIALGTFGILNSIFLWIPMFVQGHAVGSASTPRNTALRIVGGIISAALIAGGIAMIAM